MPPSASGTTGPQSSRRLRNKEVLGWALYDWANSAFATTVMAGFFPVFFKKYWSAGADVTQSTFFLGLANSASSLVLALLAPFLGAMADIATRKKDFLLAFTVLGVLMTLGLCFIGHGQWPWAIGFYGLAAVGFAGANIFYDALLVNLVPADRWDATSAWGYALGYLGGALLFTINVAMYLKPMLFGFTDGVAAIRWSFALVALWWAAFSVPLFAWVPEGAGRKDLAWGAVTRAGWSRLFATFREIRRLRAVFLFLLAFLFYNDGVNTIIKMAVDYGLSLGFADSHLITALLITNFVGFPAAVAFGYLGERVGPRNGIFLALFVYSGVTIGGFFMTRPIEFYAMAVAIGLVQGGIQALSRSYYARLIPPDASAEFFGFFNMLGKFSAILGPLLVGGVSYVSGSPRASILVILAFFAAGAAGLVAHGRALKT